MANYATLKSAIEQVIKTNGNNEITGALLQQSLLSMINSLGAGYQFVDVATPSTNPGNPDQNVMYFAATAGTYTNFGGIVVNDGEACFLCYNGTWTKKVSGSATAAQVAALGQEVGKYAMPITESRKYIKTDTGVGNAIGGVVANNSYSYIRFPVTGGDIVIVNGTGGSAPRLWCFVDENGIILSVANSSVSASDLYLIAPEDSAEIIINTSVTTTPSYYLSKNSLENVLAEDMKAIWGDIDIINLVLFQGPTLTLNAPADGIIHYFKCYIPANTDFNIGEISGIYWSSGTQVVFYSGDSVVLDTGRVYSRTTITDTHNFNVPITKVSIKVWAGTNTDSVFSLQNPMSLSKEYVKSVTADSDIDLLKIDVEKGGVTTSKKFDILTKTPISDNDSLNEYIRELYLVPKSYGHLDHIEIARSKLHTNGKYRNRVVLYFDSYSQSVVAVYLECDTQEQAENSLRDFYFGYDWGGIVVNWSKLQPGGDINFNTPSVKFNNYYELAYRSILAGAFVQGYDFVNDVEQRKNNVGCFLCSDNKTIFLDEWFTDPGDVALYVNGARLQNSIDYTAYPNRKCIVLSNAINSTDKLSADIVSTIRETRINASFSGLVKLPQDNKITGLDARTNFGFQQLYRAHNFEIQGATNYAEIVADPINNTQSALHLFMNSATTDLAENKGRVQIDFTGISNILYVGEVDQSVDLLIPSDFGDTLESANSEINWLTIQEWWANASTFRMSIDISKPAGVNTGLWLRLRVEDNDGGYTPVITPIRDNSFRLPYDEWMTIHTKIVPGNSEFGKFMLEVIDGNGVTHPIFNVTCRTFGTNYASPADFVNYFSFANPIKLYTAESVIQHFIESGKTMDLYFKNYKLLGHSPKV